MIDAMGLTHWFIDVVVCTLDIDLAGDCQTQSGYDRAAIRIDPAKFDCHKSVLRTLRHELLHLTHHQFDVYREGAIQVLTDDLREALEASYQNACEVSVRQQESMLDKLGLTPQKLVRIGLKMRVEPGSSRFHKPKRRGSTPRPATSRRGALRNTLTNTRRHHGRG